MVSEVLISHNEQFHENTISYCSHLLHLSKLKISDKIDGSWNDTSKAEQVSLSYSFILQTVSVSYLIDFRAEMYHLTFKQYLLETYTTCTGVFCFISVDFCRIVENFWATLFYDVGLRN